MSQSAMRAIRYGEVHFNNDSNESKICRNPLCVQLDMESPLTLGSFMLIRSQSAMRAIRYGDKVSAISVEKNGSRNPLCVQLDMEFKK